MKRLVIALTTLLTLAGVVVVALYLFVLAGAGDRAARIVPADTAIYVNVYLQPSSGQQMELNGLIGRFPGFRDLATLDQKIHQLAQRFLVGAGVDYATDLRPWLGSQVALAIAPLDARAEPPMLLVVTVKDRQAAEEAAPRIISGGEASFRPEEHRDVVMMVGEPASYAFVDELLVVSSTPDRLRTVIDTARGEAASLADQAAFQSAMHRLPADHLASAYVDLASTPLAEFAALAGVSQLAAALRAEEAGLHLVGYAPLEADPGAGRPSLPRADEPTSLAEWMPADTEAAVVFFSAGELLDALEEQAARQPETADLATTLRQLGALAALGLLDGEVAVALNGMGGELTGQLLLRPTDPATAASERISAALELMGAEISIRHLGGGPIAVVELPQLPSFAYAVVDDVVVVGLDAELVAAVASSRSSGETLAAGESYRAAFALAGTRGGIEAYLDAGALLRAFGAGLPISEQDRVILQPIHAIGLTLPVREDQIEIHLVMTIR